MGCLRVLSLSFLFLVGVGLLLYTYNEWQRVEKRVTVRMRSSNEDCDAEFRCTWKIDQVLEGPLTAEEATSSCYLINSQRSYAKHDSVEWIVAQGVYTNEDGQAFYADCAGILRFHDKSVSRVVGPL